MGIEVTVVTNGSELGELILQAAWRTAVKLFKDYGIEVYVTPYQVKKGNVLIVINGLEFQVTRPLSIDELSNLILSAASSEGKWNSEVLLGIELLDEGNLGNGVVAS